MSVPVYAPGKGKEKLKGGREEYKWEDKYEE